MKILFQVRLVLYIIYIVHNLSHTDEVQDPLTEALGTYIRIMHHPHSGITEDLIIPLVNNESADLTNFTYDHGDPRAQSWSGNNVPWLPFRTREDFEYTSTAVRGVLRSELVDEQLYGIHHGWAQNPKITLRNSADMKAALAAARQDGVQVHLFVFIEVRLLTL